MQFSVISPENLFKTNTWKVQIITEPQKIEICFHHQYNQQEILMQL